MFFLVLVFATQAAAGISVTASHRLVSQTEGSAGFDISLSLTVQNTGADDLSNVVLEMADPNLIALPGSNTYSLGYLPAKTPMRISWALTSPMPLMDSGLPLIILGRGTDLGGNAVEFSLVSTGVTP